LFVTGEVVRVAVPPPTKSPPPICAKKKKKKKEREEGREGRRVRRGVILHRPNQEEGG